MMYEMDYEKSLEISNVLINKMIDMGLNIGEMEVVSEHLKDDLHQRLQQLHVSPNELMSDSIN